MKNILILVLTVASVLGAQAQTSKSRVAIEDINIIRIEDNARVSFRAEIGKRAARNSHTLVITPVIQDNGIRTELPAIVVRGRKSAIAEKRNTDISGTETAKGVYAYTRNKETVEYTANIPLQKIGAGANLVIEMTDKGCCNEALLAPMEVADNFITEETILKEAEFKKVSRPMTAGDSLARIYPFVLPASVLNGAAGKSVEQFIDESGEGSLVVYYRQSSHKIEGNFRGNTTTLEELTKVIGLMEKAEDSRIGFIVVAGGASPEGPASFNSKLGIERAIAVKSYLEKNSSVNPEEIYLYNKSIDWSGLRDYVEKSGEPWKKEALEIIDNSPASRRLRDLQNLQGGEPYKYMYEHWFPELRQAAYIKVYYRNN